VIGIPAAALAGSGVLLVELLLIAVRRDRGWRGLLANALAGLLLMAAVGLAAEGRRVATLVCLALAGLAHVADVVHRIRAR
jgi:hypothetical protein